MTTLISSVRDLEVWAANMFPDLDGDQTGRIARAIWDREDFPHPVNNTRLDDYLDALDDKWLYEQAEA